MTTIEKYNGGAVESAEEWGRDRIELVKRTYCAGATDDELALFVNTCQRTGLSPEARQIFAIKRKSKVDGRWVEVLQTQTSIDGYRLIAQRSNAYAGQIQKQWCGRDGRWVDVWLSNDAPAAAKAGVYRKGFVEPLVAVATWGEYVQTTDSGPTKMWKDKPALMLAKCAEALALRAAFPAELSGLYTAEEMGQADSIPVKVHAIAPPGVDPATGEIGAPPAKVATKRPPPAKKATDVVKDAIADPTVKLLVADLNGIEDPEARKEAKDEFVLRFGKPEELKPEQYEEAAAFVASVCAPF